jgi:NitT/TauT family transport system substrate-binding protein
MAKTSMPRQSRRRFLATTALAGATVLLRPPALAAAEGTLETTTVRIIKSNAICIAPQYIAQELLRAEGFTDIRFVEVAQDNYWKALTEGKVDFGLSYASTQLTAIAAGAPITLLAGVMVGCFELFAREGIGSIAELKGKRVGKQALGSNGSVLLSLIAALVGLDPANDIRWVGDPSVKPIELFVAGKIDAFLAFPPEPQELRARQIGHVLLDTAVDHPWSQYFCCMLAGSRRYVRDHPVATKHFLRAILKTADLCAAEPGRAARLLVDGGFTPRYDYALQILKDNPYDKWREYDAEDTVRFYALRLREAGLIRSSPQKIIAENTDWRFLEELKQELKT